MPDNCGYPTDDEMVKLAVMCKSGGGIPQDINCATAELILFLESIWHWPDYGFKKRNGRDLLRRKCIKLELHTGGWSGNEEIIEKLSHSWFWFLYWEKSVRGGHYYFDVRTIAASAKKQTNSGRPDEGWYEKGGK